MKKISKETENLIVIDYLDKKKSTTEIGKIFNVSPTCISNVLKRNKIELRDISSSKKGVKRGTKLPVDQIIKFYCEDKKTSEEIAKIIGYTQTSVLKILKGNKIEIRKSGWSDDYINPLTEEIRDIYLSGKGMLDVSKKTGMSYSGIYKILDRLSIIRSEDLGKSFLGKHHTLKSKNKIRKTKKENKEAGNYDHIYIKRTGYPYHEFIKIQPLYKQYHNKVRSITNRQDLSSLQNFNKRGKTGMIGKYHLDHKYSIKESFINDSDPEIIGNIKNLEFIKWEDNVKKQQGCSITISELLSIINE